MSQLADVNTKSSVGMFTVYDVLSSFCCKTCIEFCGHLAWCGHRGFGLRPPRLRPASTVFIILCYAMLSPSNMRIVVMFTAW